MDHVDKIQFRDVDVLRRFLSEEAKMESRRKTGVCSKHQRALARAIKRGAPAGDHADGAGPPAHHMS